MTSFSRRYAYDPRRPREPLLEDAPEWLRVAYLNGILHRLTYVDRDSRYENYEDRPIGIKELYEDLSLLMREPPGDQYYDSWHCSQELEALVMKVEWYYFYDLVELVAEKLRTAEEGTFPNEDWAKAFGFQAYLRAVNELFAEDNIGWRLNDHGQLIREVPRVYRRHMQQANDSLQDIYEPARNHYRKAIRYVYERPTDPENGVKEIVSAIESIGRTIYHGTSTLGDVIRELRRSETISVHLVNVIDKFYVYANAESSIRHGSSVGSTVSLVDAEFCLHVGTALIRYFISKHTDV